MNKFGNGIPEKLDATSVSFKAKLYLQEVNEKAM
jgi:hypothetical protein